MGEQDCRNTPGYGLSYGLSSDRLELLRLLLRKKGITSGDRQQLIRRRDLVSPPPLSFGQEGIWFHTRLESNSSTYNISSAIRLRGKLDRVALERSLNHIIERHESLRTTFIVIKERPVQVISPELKLPISIERLQPEGEEKMLSRVRKIASEEAARPFDLSVGPLLRFRLLRLDEKEHVALVTFHHIICDGWSLGVFMSEISQLYEAFSQGRPSPLGEPRLQFADFACWQREFFQAETIEEQMRYWKRQLSGSLPILELPTDRLRPPVRSSKGREIFFSIPEDVLESLETLSQAVGVTLFMSLLAAFQILLRSYTGQDDILVGSSIANRKQSDLEEVIGLFINTVVFRTKLSGDPTLRELLDRVRQVTIDAYNHQEVPFERLVQELRLDRNDGRHPLFQVMFVFQNLPTPSLNLAGLELTWLDVEMNIAIFDLTLFLTKSEFGLDGRLQYNTDLFELQTIHRIRDDFTILLHGMTLADAANPISELPLSSSAEERYLLECFNDSFIET